MFYLEKNIPLICSKNSLQDCKKNVRKFWIWHVQKFPCSLQVFSQGKSSKFLGFLSTNKFILIRAESEINANQWFRDKIFFCLALVAFGNRTIIPALQAWRCKQVENVNPPPQNFLFLAASYRVICIRPKVRWLLLLLFMKSDPPSYFTSTYYTIVQFVKKSSTFIHQITLLCTRNLLLLHGTFAALST